MRLYSDDDVRRTNLVWHGPTGWTLPWSARYLAYVTGLCVFVAILLIEAVTPIPSSYIPVWEVSITVLVTTALMMLVDHDRPLPSVLRDFVTELRGPRDRNHETCYQPRMHKVRVRGTDA